MPKLTSRRLRRYWYLLAGIVMLTSLTPGLGVQSGLLQIYFDRFWFHFLTYAVVSILPLLAWERKPGLMLSSGIAILSIGLEILRGFVTGVSVDVQGMIVNLLGVAAGILLGLNILTLRSRVSRADGSSVDASQSDLS